MAINITTLLSLASKFSSIASLLQSVDVSAYEQDLQNIVGDVQKTVSDLAALEQKIKSDISATQASESTTTPQE